MAMLSEAEGRAVLRERFTRAGLHIVEDFPFDELGVCFSMDGFDPAQRTGYEYLTTEAGDRMDLTNDEIASLEGRIATGQLAILLIDETAGLTADGLAFAADRFIEHLRKTGYLKKAREGQESAP